MGKLVRDRVPELMKKAGEEPTVRVLHGNLDYLYELRAKLLEEVREYETSGWKNEELIDVIEVVDALEKHVDTMTGGSLTRLREQKLAEKGGFEERQYLFLGGG